MPLLLEALHFAALAIPIRRRDLSHDLEVGSSEVGERSDPAELSSVYEHGRFCCGVCQNFLSLFSGYARKPRKKFVHR